MNENQFATTARLQSSHFPIHHHSARLHYQINPIHVINVVVVVLLTWLTGLLMIWAWFGHKPPANNQPAEKSYQPSQPAIASSFNEKHTTRSSARPDQYTAWFIGQMCCNATPTHCVCIFKLLIKMLLIFFAISVCNCLLCPACLPACPPASPPLLHVLNSLSFGLSIRLSPRDSTHKLDWYIFHQTIEIHY